MLEFKRLTEEDFSKIDKYFAEHTGFGDSRICDYAPGTVKMWHDAYKMEYAEEGGLLYLKAHYEEEGTSYLMPVGKWHRDGLLPLYEYLAGRHATLSVIPNELRDEVCKVFGLSENDLYVSRDWADYVYLRKEFITPSGKKQHNYKNHLNRFSKEHPDFSVEPVTWENKAEALEYFKTYCVNNPDSSSVDDEEYAATLPVIADLSGYGMTGAVLRADGRIIGITIGEIYRDTVIVHIEKAEKDIVGAYQTLARGYQQMMPENVVYINREEDMGLEGLRRSKLSYAPLRLDYKYTASL